MSRFLDAMRDRGKPGVEGEAPRAYRGSIVDASEVLGTADQLTLVDEDLVGARPARSASVDPSTAADQSPDPYPEAVRSKSPGQSAYSNMQTPHNSEPGIESPVESNVTPESVAGDGRGYQPTERPASREPRGFLPRLDPLFYLIIGIAAAGLFLCLYALITQNDAYFEREYQQLQKESAALQARLAASAELQADLFAANQRVLENNAPSEVVTATVESDSNVDQPADSTPLAETPQPENGSAAISTKPEVVADNGVVEGDSEPLESTAASAAKDSGEDTVDPMLVLLQQEVSVLKDTLSRQEQIINRLERDNRELNAIRQTPPAKQPESEPLSDAVLESQSSPPLVADNFIEGTQSAVQVSAGSGVEVASVVPRNTPSLVSPLQSASEEVGDLIRQGYLAYQAKDYNASASYYGKALEFDPYSRDANLGVAAIAQLNGDNRLAEDRYRHLLTLDPADETAFSALLNLSGASGQGSIIEFELLQHVENTSEIPALYAILGNYYSGQKRWSKASDSYAVAVQGGVVRPDYLFNYAVSLDNEGRAEKAVEYYSQALTAMEGETHSFDDTAARQRLESLLQSR